MGDNIYLGDRDGVRTPMQWSPDRNGGSCRANPQQLYAPPIQDPIFGYQAVNVEAQQQSPGSLLQLDEAADRRPHRPADIRPRHASPSSTRAIARSWPTCAITRARRSCASTIFPATLQACDLDLGGFPRPGAGRAVGPDRFPTDQRPELSADACPATAITGWRWPRRASSTAGISRQPEPLPELITIVLHDNYKAISDSRGGRELARQVLPEYLPKQTGSWVSGSIRSRLARAGELRGRSATICWPSSKSCRRREPAQSPPAAVRGDLGRGKPGPGSTTPTLYPGPRSAAARRSAPCTTPPMRTISRARCCA